MGDGSAGLADHLDRHCLRCGSSDLEPLLLLSREGAPPNTPEHDFAYEHDVVVLCPACAAVRLESWRHDCFDFESAFDRHWYFPVDEEGARTLAHAADLCPAPLDPACGCAVHRSLVESLGELPPRDFTRERAEGVQAVLRVSTRGRTVRFRPSGPASEDG